jgi:hypothetical protein
MNNATSRREFMGRVTLGSMGIQGSASAGEAAGLPERYLNFYIYGPFAFVIYEKGDSHIDVLAPCIMDHSIAVLTSSLSETPVPCGAWKLDLPDAPANSFTGVPGSGPYIIDVRKEGLVVDPGKTRYFSLRLPLPESISPLRPVDIRFGAGGPYVAAPVGLLARFKLGLDTKPSVDNFVPKFSSAETTQLSLFLDYRPERYDLDPTHAHAQKAFASLQSLFSRKSPTGAPMNVSLTYHSDTPVAMSPCDKAAASHLVPDPKKTGPGHNCRAPILLAINPEA